MQIKSFLTFICLILLLAPAPMLLGQPTGAYTKLDSLECCAKAEISFPIHVNKIINVDSFSLSLTYNPSVLTYESYTNLNSALDIPDDTLGSFEVINGTGSIRINWNRNTAFNLSNGTLLTLNFRGNTGKSTLRWNTDNPSDCFYHCTGDSLLEMQFVNGLATVDTALRVVLKELNATCKGKCDANFMATPSGGTKPYYYLWNNVPGHYGNIQTDLCDSINKIHITDSKGCVLDSTFDIKGLPGPVITLTMKCDGIELIDTLYRENPILTFEVESDDAVQPPFRWDFGDGDTASTVENTITHVYANANTPSLRKYVLSLTVMNSNGCDSIYQYTINIKDDSLVKINNVLVPSGSPKNRIFVIADKNDPDWVPLVHRFRNIEVVIFDRWGRKVYANSNYQCDWTAPGLPDGVYYYVLKTVGYFTTQKHKGSITILGSGQ